MKVYRADWQGPDGCFMVWAASKREAEHLQREALKNTGDHAEAGAVRPVHIPDTRPALVAWLNRNYNADNG
jgi:hypothetical protein